MSKRSAEAETAAGIPDEPKEKAAKLGGVDEASKFLFGNPQTNKVTKSKPFL